MIGSSTDHTQRRNIQYSVQEREGLACLKRPWEDPRMSRDPQKLIENTLRQKPLTSRSPDRFQKITGPAVLRAIAVRGIQQDIGVDDSAFHFSMRTSKASRSARFTVGRPIEKLGSGSDLRIFLRQPSKPRRRNSLAKSDMSRPSACASSRIPSRMASSSTSVVLFIHSYIRHKHTYARNEFSVSLTEV